MMNGIDLRGSYPEEDFGTILLEDSNAAGASGISVGRLDPVLCRTEFSDGIRWALAEASRSSSLTYPAADRHAESDTILLNINT